MDFHLAAMKRFYPQTGTTDEWNSAYYRLEDYFRAHHLTDQVHQSQIILRLLERAAAQHALNPNQTPTQLAMAEAYEVMDRWFQRLLPDEPAQRAAMVGRVSMSVIQATERWPNAFLAEDHELPAEFRTALRDISVQNGPDLSVSSMVPRPLDVYPAEEETQETWERVGRLSVALLVGIGALLAGGTLYYFSR